MCHTSFLGDGTYGLVYLAQNLENKERVAVKTMKKAWTDFAMDDLTKNIFAKHFL